MKDGLINYSDFNVMENTSIVFFGKPNSFESYEFKVDGITKNNHAEPKLKLNQDQKDILHYYHKDDFYYLELYGFANAFNSGRSGIVIGVCLKSDKQFELSDKNISVLVKLLGFFKKKVLSGVMFNSTSLGKYIETFDIHKDEIYQAIDYRTTGSSQLINNLALLFLEDYENKIQFIGEEIINYADIYISSNKDIFGNPLNNGVFYEANNLFHVVSDGKIIECKEQKKKSNDELKSEGQFTQEDKDNKPEINKLKLEISKGINEINDLKVNLKRTSHKYKRALTIVSITSVVLLSSTVYYFLEFYRYTKPKTIWVNEKTALTKKISDLENKLASAETQIKQKDETAILITQIAEVAVGKSIKLKFTVKSSNVIWKSDDTNVATVKDGVVTGVKSDSTPVTITASSDGVTTSCKVLVIGKHN